MVEDRIGYRYAKSLFDLAVEKGEVKKAGTDMELLRDTIAGSRDLATFLKSPLIDSTRKQKIIDRIFQGKFQSVLTEKLLNMVIRKGREMYLPQLAEAFLRLYDKQQNIQRGVLSSAVVLSDTQVAEIKSAMEKEIGSKLELVQAINPDLIGGFVLKIDDILFDGSVSGSLRRLKQQFVPQYHA